VPKNRHLVINLHYVPDSKDGIETDYYLVDHDRRKIFFLDPFEAESMTAWWEARGCNSMKHLGSFLVLYELAELSNVVVRYRDGGSVLVNSLLSRYTDCI